MYHALDLGMTADEFWNTTPRAICILMDEMLRSSGGAKRVESSGRTSAAGSGQVVKLSYIPRP